MAPDDRVDTTRRLWSLGDYAMTDTLLEHLPAPPPGAPSPRQWADLDELERIFAAMPV
ncbi:MAG: hypothetical protein ACR2K0_03030 [Acidimicrobiales bacterium]|jgi:hypothetical protein